jgi:hypothetical protein
MRVIFVSLSGSAVGYQNPHGRCGRLSAILLRLVGILGDVHAADIAGTIELDRHPLARLRHGSDGRPLRVVQPAVAARQHEAALVGALDDAGQFRVAGHHNYTPFGV